MGCGLFLNTLLNLLNHAGFDRETAAYAMLGVMIGLTLGYVIGFYIPIPGVTHHKTVTPAIVNKTTTTVPINATKTVTYISTTTVGGRVEAIAMTTTTVEVTTTTIVIHH